MLHGSIWEDGNGSEMEIKKTKDGYYGEDGQYDFLRKTEEETIKQLKQWGYKRTD